MNMFSKWFYIGIVALLIGLFIIGKSSRYGKKNKSLENGYLILILGFVGVLSEFFDFATVLLIFLSLSGVIIAINKLKSINSTKSSSKSVPHYVYYSKEFFPIVLSVFILRAFIVEAYLIPSSSMRPGLVVGDFILVNKFSYGIKLPVTNDVIIPIGNVKRGDVVVFKDQEVRNRDLIKRVIGLPGDIISYNNKRLSINNKPLNYQIDGAYSYNRDQSVDSMQDYIQTDLYIENLLGLKHNIIINNEFPTLFLQGVKDFPYRSNCIYNGDESFTCKVPNDYYFMMGDNRDDSEDSRYFGFVPNNAILGKAFLVWMNFHDFTRIGTRM